MKTNPMLVSPFMRQVGGTHYLPDNGATLTAMEFAIEQWGADAPLSHALKYITRHRMKNGAVDLAKAMHCIEMVIYDSYGKTYAEFFDEAGDE